MDLLSCVTKQRSFMLMFILSVYAVDLLYGQTTRAEVEWSRSYGGSRKEASHQDGTGKGAFTAAPGGGYIFVSTTNSIDGDIDINFRHHDSRELVDSFQNMDLWIVKLSSAGTTEWERYIGGEKNDFVTGVIPTHDGGYVLYGFTLSVSGDFFYDTTGQSDAYNKGALNDEFMLKLDSTGDKQWLTRVGGTNSLGDRIANLIETSDGSFLVCGKANSTDEYANGLSWINHASLGGAAYIAKISSDGKPLWNRFYGGSRSEAFLSVIETASGGFILGGSTLSIDGDVDDSPQFRGDTQIGWIAEVDSLGTMLRHRYIGGTRGDAIFQVIPTSDKGYIFVSATSSKDGDVVGYHIPLDSTRRFTDAWVVKTDSAWNILYQRCVGGSSWDAFTLHPTQKSTYVFCGYTNSSDYDLLDIHDTLQIEDIWVGEMTEKFDILWQKCLGGSNYDLGIGIADASNGFVVCGATESNDGDVSNNHLGKDGPSPDIWLAKLSVTNSVEASTGESHWAHPYPNPASGDEINLRIHPTAKVKQVEFISPLGTVFTIPYKLAGNLLTADISDLSSGMYILHVTYEGITFEERRKFVKE